VAAEQWLAVKRATLAPKSIRAEESNLKHLLPFFGGMLTTDIEASDIARYQEQRKREQAAAGTINLEISTVRAILRRLGLWARLQPEVRMLPERQDVGKALAPEEESKLLRACEESMSRSLLPALVLSLNSGLRYGELVSLRWSQVDFMRRRVTVGKSKTAAGTGRTIPLNDRAFGALSTLASRFPEREPDHFVIPSEKYQMLPARQGSVAYATDPERPMGTLKEAWEAARRRAAVFCRWHDLRHSFLTRLIEAGTPFPRLSIIMGWSAATTARMARRYGHVSPDSLRDDVVALDRFSEKGIKGHDTVSRPAPFS
jgi:integrase